MTGFMNSISIVLTCVLAILCLCGYSLIIPLAIVILLENAYFVWNYIDMQNTIDDMAYALSDHKYLEYLKETKDSNEEHK